MSIIDDFENSITASTHAAHQQFAQGDILGGVETSASGELGAQAGFAQGAAAGAAGAIANPLSALPWGKIALVAGSGLLVSVVLASIARKFVLP